MRTTSRRLDDTKGRKKHAMSDYDEYDNDTSPKALRDHAKALEKQLEDLKKSLETEKAARTAAEKAAKSASLADLLRSANIDPKFAKLAERDGIDPTADAVKAWVKENEDFYNFGAKKATEAEEPEAEAETEVDEFDPEMAAALEQSAQLDSAGKARSPRDPSQIIAGLPDNLSFDEGVALMREKGLLG